VGVQALNTLTSGRPHSPRVAVIVPVRNRRDLLLHTLEALATQTFADHEVIVVDDGSTDGSGDVAIAQAHQGQPVRVIRARGHGAVAARTQGVEETSAPILAFTDSDCRPDARWLEAAVAAIDDGADVVQGLTRPAGPVRPLERSVWSLTDDGLFATCNVLYRRTMFESMGGFDGQAGERLGFRPGSRLRGYGFGEDTLLGWRARRAGRAAFVPEAIVEHAVLPPDLTDAFTRAWTMGAFPGLLREVPELRVLMADDLRRGFRRRLPLYVLAAGLVTRRRGLATVAMGAWIGGRGLELRHADASPARRLRTLGVLLGMDATHAVALVWGSIRARNLVL
jgi:Glycosyl transferase family 2